LPTKPEQGDLLQALYGRNGESPIPVVAAATPGDCFEVAIEAFRIAVRHMTPVVMLSDAYLANGSEPWRIPDVADLERIDVVFARTEDSPQPYARQAQTYARPWIVPGTPGLEHRVGTLEKENITGNVSYDPENHQLMTELRQRKVESIAEFIPEQGVDGPDSGELLVVSWGSTFGPCRSAVRQAQADGFAVAHAHLRYLNPFPRNLERVLRRYDRVVVPELNMGQLRLLLRARFLIDILGVNQCTGLPFRVDQLHERIVSACAKRAPQQKEARA
jgi:2-oxoglutarate ferredoxin oxidoreductase subunit alpha